MAKRLSPEEIRRFVLEEDKKKDVNIYIAVLIGVIAALSATAALAAATMMRALEFFRADVSAYWLSCVPFMFPCLTGLYTGYKKDFGVLGVHFAVTALALLLGGLGFGISVERIFVNRANCLYHEQDLPCNKESLAYLCLISGALASGLEVLCMVLTICACYFSTKRIGKRHREEEVRHTQEMIKKQREIRRQRTESLSTVGSIRQTPKQCATNGFPNAVPPKRTTQSPLPSVYAPQNPTNTAAATGKADAASTENQSEKITTRL